MLKRDGASFDVLRQPSSHTDKIRQMPRKIDSLFGFSVVKNVVQYSCFKGYRLIR